MPGGVHRLQGVGVRDQKVRAVRKDGEEEALCNAVVKKGLDPRTGGGKPLNKGETGLGQGDPVREMMLGVLCWGEPVAEPSDHPDRAEDEAV